MKKSLVIIIVSLVLITGCFQKKEETASVPINKGDARTNVTPEPIAAQDQPAPQPIEIPEPDRMSDFDQDGLTLYDEWLYATDPENPDTDGDTYTDAEEVKAGYVPTNPEPVKYKMYEEQPELIDSYNDQVSWNTELSKTPWVPIPTKAMDPVVFNAGALHGVNDSTKDATVPSQNIYLLGSTLSEDFIKGYAWGYGTLCFSYVFTDGEPETEKSQSCFGRLQKINLELLSHR